MLARRLGGSDWATRKAKASPWRFALTGTYAVGTVTTGSNGDNGTRSVYVVRVVPATATIEYALASNAQVNGRGHPDAAGLIDLAGTGGPPPALPGSGGAVGRYATTPGAVAQNPSSLYPAAHALATTDAFGGGLAMRMLVPSGSTGNVRVTDLRTGQVTQGTRLFPLAGFRSFTTGTAVYGFPGTAGGPGNSGATMLLGATVTLAQVEVAADANRPRRYRLTRAVLDDDGRPMFYRGVNGQADAGLYLYTWQRPLTTGTRGRGINLSLAAGHVVRSRVCWIRASMRTFEHEIGPVLTTGALPSGSKATTHLLRTYDVVRGGFIRLTDAGADFLWLATTVTYRESDLTQYYKDDGTTEDTWNFQPPPGRSYQLVSTERTESFPAGARDIQAKAKGTDPDWDPTTSVPGVVTQSRLLAVNAGYIDRYGHDGKYIDRIANPVGGSSRQNQGWIHEGYVNGALSGSQGIPFYLAHSDSLCLPVTIAGSTATHYVTSNAGQTWDL